MQSRCIFSPWLFLVLFSVLGSQDGFPFSWFLFETTALNQLLWKILCRGKKKEKEKKDVKKRKLNGNNKPDGEKKSFNNTAFIQVNYNACGETSLNMAQGAYVAYCMGVKWPRWSFCVVGGRHKAENETVGSSVLCGRRKAVPRCAEVPWPSLFSSRANCAGCVFRSYKGTFLKERFTCVRSAWGIGKPRQYIVPFKSWLYFQSSWYLVLISKTLHWIFGFPLTQTTQMFFLQESAFLGAYASQKYWRW